MEFTICSCNHTVNALATITNTPLSGLTKTDAKIQVRERSYSRVVPLVEAASLPYVKEGRRRQSSSWEAAGMTCVAAWVAAAGEWRAAVPGGLWNPAGGGARTTAAPTIGSEYRWLPKSRSYATSN